jgi:hypothetical protein
MSILDALRVQKAGQKSIQELSQLPQQEIMQMAQMGQIPADVVPVVISEKARLAQQAAQAQAMQNPRPPSVMDQAMQVNAQHEQQGLPAIPTQGMFQEQNYQAGGIVGYAGPDGSEVEGYKPDEINALAERGDSGLGKYVQQALAQQRAINAMPIATSKAEQDLAAMLGKPPADENKMMWMSLLRGGLKALGGSSPYANVNLGQGLGEAAQSYEEGLKEQQKNKLAYAKEMADQARAQRQEGLGALTIGAKLLEADMASKAALEKAIASGNMNSYVRFQVEAAREAGDKTPPAQLAAKAAREYAEIVAALETRRTQAAASGTSAQAATKQADTSATKAGDDATLRREEIARKREEDARQAQETYGKRVDEAKKRVDAMIADPPTSAFRKDMRKEGVGPFRERLLREELKDIPVPMGMPRSSATPPPSRGGPPPGFRPPPPPGFSVIPQR